MSLAADAPSGKAGGLGWAQGFDSGLLAAAAGLALAGFVLSLAASPTAPGGADPSGAFSYVWRHAAYLGVGLLVFAAAASVPAALVRRAAALIFVVAIALLIAVLLVGYETKGAQRWLRLGGFSLQPVEILKPALVVLMAWMLSERMRLARFPGDWAAVGLFGLSAALLLRQPDFGQTMLLALTLLAMLVLAGVSWRWLLGGVGALALAGAAAFLAFSHVRSRIVAFFRPEGEGAYQVERALDAIRSGGLLGRGPGEGVIKHRLPDAHSDFVFAVAAEEFGLLASIGLLALYAVVVWRGLARAARLIDPFQQLAAAGLFLMLAAQAGIHVAVNLDLLPAKGMTLPLASYGGSSIVGAALALGFACALTRRRPGAMLYDVGQDRA